MFRFMITADIIYFFYYNRKILYISINLFSLIGYAMEY